MTVLEAAEKVLSEAGHSLSAKDLTAQMLLKGYWKTQDRRPETTVRACLDEDLKNKGKTSLFLRPQPGHYGLRDRPANEKPVVVTKPAGVQPAPGPMELTLRLGQPVPMPAEPAPTPVAPTPKPVAPAPVTVQPAKVRRPVKFGKPEIILQVGTEEGSLTLLMIEVLAWKASDRSLFDFKREPDRGKEVVFWLEQDERTLEKIFEKKGPPTNLFQKTAFRENFDEALHDFLDPHQWWLLPPIQVHPGWESAIGSELDRQFPGWENRPAGYASAWPSSEAWRRRFELSKTPE